MNDDQPQLKDVIKELKKLSIKIDRLQKDVNNIKENIPENFYDLRITTDGALEEIIKVTESLGDDDLCIFGLDDEDLEDFNLD